MKPNRDVEQQIFANFPGFKSDEPGDNKLYDSTEIYAADICQINVKLKPSRLTKHYSFNISGGIVVSNQVNSLAHFLAARPTIDT